MKRVIGNNFPILTSHWHIATQLTEGDIKRNKLFILADVLPWKDEYPDDIGDIIESEEYIMRNILITEMIH